MANFVLNDTIRGAGQLPAHLSVSTFTNPDRPPHQISLEAINRYVNEEVLEKESSYLSQASSYDKAQCDKLGKELAQGIDLSKAQRPLSTFGSSVCIALDDIFLWKHCVKAIEATTKKFGEGQAALNELKITIDHVQARLSEIVQATVQMFSGDKDALKTKIKAHVEEKDTVKLHRPEVNQDWDKVLAI